MIQEVNIFILGFLHFRVMCPLLLQRVSELETREDYPFIPKGCA